MIKVVCDFCGEDLNTEPMATIDIGGNAYEVEVSVSGVLSGLKRDICKKCAASALAKCGEK